jgi:hypothetical protein
MTQVEAYKRFTVLFRRMKYFGMVVAVLGVVTGLVANHTARTVIWIVPGH